MGRIIGLDYGRKRTGIAVTDPDRIIATPLATVPTHTLLDWLKKYMAGEEVDEIIIGEPRQKDNTASEAEQYIRPFIGQCRKLFPDLIIERVDERFTSVMAAKAIFDSGVNRKTRQDKSLVDKVSAAIILQTYLDMQKYTK